MEETIGALLALNGYSLRVTRIAENTVRTEVVSLIDPSVRALELAIDVQLDPARRWYSFTTRLWESDGRSTSQRVHWGRFHYRIAGVEVNLDGVHSYEFDSAAVFDLLEQRLHTLAWRPKPGFWDRLFGRAR